ncbi:MULTISPECIES: glycosyltransferase family 4 protein [unclassified Novosphingobium]|uniref:glycosyltransferase family 4 protein n=1 Tax=unclassified Novosphingobium TaxID=2644732 RepID=UPI00135C1A46|nr:MULTISPECIES: glycosyltransferase family 4 protein [unclassified Novosphingobium]
MRPLIFLFPHDRMNVGGNSAQMRFFEACCRFTAASVAFYGERIAGHLHLDDCLTQDTKGSSSPIFVIHWGPDIAMLLERLKGHDVVYFAHSTGWGMALPSKVPVLCVSRHTMAYWGRHAPNSYIAHVPNVVEVDSSATARPRDIDVLVQGRKSSRYLLERLVPALQERCRVALLDGWVDDLSAWFRRSSVYLYDSLEHWADVGATEGFGLPPLEAMGHGCVVFSSVNDALADYLDPGFNCRKIRVHSLEWDVAEVLRAVNDRAPAPPPAPWFAGYSTDMVASRLETVFGDLDRFFDLTADIHPDIEDLWALRRPTPLQRAKRAVRVLAGS